MLILSLLIIICGEGTLDILNQSTDIVIINILSNDLSNIEQNTSLIYTPEEQIENCSYNDWESATYRPRSTYNLWDFY